MIYKMITVISHPSRTNMQQRAFCRWKF